MAVDFTDGSELWIVLMLHGRPTRDKIELDCRGGSLELELLEFKALWISEGMMRP